MAPVAARITELKTEAIQAKVPNRGVCHPSQPAHPVRPSTQIAPDMSICPDCMKEIMDPQDRHYRYPFTNCTNCGPRFSIVKRVPYDRPNTSMQAFTMCEQCSREYHDPLDRRFHAQPNACPQCGPELSWHDDKGAPLPGDCLASCAQALQQGKLVAIKGLGGFHLAADGTSEEAVALLRRRKHRPAKPLAIMVRDLQTARAFCRISEEEAALLLSPEHPIVLVEPAQNHASCRIGCTGAGKNRSYAAVHTLACAFTQ